jgi:hypothetical protein
MSRLEKATLQAISSDESAAPLGEPIPVQFNPSSLRLQITNSVEGGESLGKQTRQYTGSSSTTLTLELIFDTADEGTTDSPRSVREKTMQVEQFVYPREEGGEKQAPPKLRFQWGDLVLEGVVDSLNMDFDHFAPNGVPLRAKVNFSFKEQDRRYQFLESGPGANKAGKASLPGQASPGALGSAGFGLSAQVGLAIGGESGAEFAARMGLDPAAWRGLSIEGGIGGALSLQAGLEVGFSANLNATAGLGVHLGAAAGAKASPEGAFGLTPEPGVVTAAQAGSGADLQQKFTLAAAGGVSAAIESVKVTKVQSAESRTREAFGAPPAAVATVHRAVMPEQARQPLTSAGMPSPSRQQQAPPAPPRPAADARAASFGFGVPLRPTAAQSGFNNGGVPLTSDPATPGWVALPAGDRSPRTAGKASGKARRPCGCTRPCGH